MPDRTAPLAELGDVRGPGQALLREIAQAGGLVALTAREKDDGVTTTYGHLVAVTSMAPALSSLPVLTLVVFHVRGARRPVAFPVSSVIRVRWDWTR